MLGYDFIEGGAPKAIFATCEHDSDPKDAPSSVMSLGEPYAEGYVVNLSGSPVYIVPRSELTRLASMHLQDSTSAGDLDITLEMLLRVDTCSLAHGFQAPIAKDVSVFRMNPPDRVAYHLGDVGYALWPWKRHWPSLICYQNMQGDRFTLDALNMMASHRDPHDESDARKLL
jgi:hypothetical protein